MYVCIYTYLFTGTCKIFKKKKPPQSRLVCKVAMQKKNSGKVEQKDKKLQNTTATLKISTYLCALKLKREAPSGASTTS